MLRRMSIVVAAFSDQVGGVSAAKVIGDLDCISRSVQQARGASAKRGVRQRLAEARACRADLSALAAAGKAAGLAHPGCETLVQVVEQPD